MVFWRKRSLLALVLLLVACGAATAQASENLDVSFISRDAIAAVVVHPQAILASSEVEMLPVEVLVAACVENFGFDPREIEEAIGILGLAGLPAGSPGMGAILRFSKPYDQAAVSARLQKLNDTREATHAGKTYQESQLPGGFGFYLAGERTLVIGTNLQLKNMLAAEKVESRLVKLLKQLDTNKPATALLDMVTIRPLIQLATGNLPPVPEAFKEFMQLPALVQWLQLNVELQDGINVSLTLASKDPAGAEKIKALAEKARAMAKQFIAAQTQPSAAAPSSATEKAMNDYVTRVVNKLLDSIEIKQAEERVEIVLIKGNQTATTGVMVALMLPAVQAGREAARRAQSVNNLKQIAIALVTYHDVKKHFPPAAIRDPEGKPLLSWRVAILPYLEQDALYKQFHLDEPWDSEHNRALLAKMPTVYGNPNLSFTDKTVYLGAAGDGMVFGAKDGLSIRAVTDGTSNTIAVVEANPDKAVEWTRPDDLTIDPAQPLAGLGQLRPGGFNTLFVDGSIHFVSSQVDPKLLAALLTIAGGEPVELPW